jgi:hypothetical protein
MRAGLVSISARAHACITLGSTQVPFQQFQTGGTGLS